MRVDLVRLTQNVLGRQSGSQVIDSWNSEGHFGPPNAEHPLPPNHMFGGATRLLLLIGALTAVTACRQPNRWGTPRSDSEIGRL
jgi:hypothetical protein